jgi:hypothetical protein
MQVIHANKSEQVIFWGGRFVPYDDFVKELLGEKDEEKKSPH